MKALIIGGGVAAEIHCKVLDALKVDIFGICDVRLAAAQALAEPFHARAFDDVDAALAEDFDFAVICTPSGTHPQLAIQSMRAGAKDFFPKPVKAEDLRAFVERVVVYELGGELSRPDVPRHDVDPVLNVPYADLSRITNKIIMIVKANYRQPQTLTGIAESMQMSGKYIGRIFLKDTGIKFSEYLMAYRMLEARKLIVSTQEKISVIAGMVGYVQLNNFYIHFRNYFGVSPSALRNFEPAGEAVEA